MGQVGIWVDVYTPEPIPDLFIHGSNAIDSYPTNGLAGQVWVDPL